MKNEIKKNVVTRGESNPGPKDCKMPTLPMSYDDFTLQDYTLTINEFLR